MDNQQPRPKGKVQRPFRKEVGGKLYRSGVLVITIQNDYDEDMVYTLAERQRGFNPSTGVAP